MRKMDLVSVVCLAASLVFAAAEEIQPFKVKTGLGQMTETIKWTGLPPQLAAMMKAASTDQDLQIVCEDKRLEYESVGGRIW